jgi:hypothetical protein
MILSETGSHPVLIRGADAEHLDSIGHVLLADSSTTGAR